MRLLTIMALAASFGTSAAGDLTISVQDIAGRPAQDAVVTNHPAASVSRGPMGARALMR